MSLSEGFGLIGAQIMLGLVRSQIPWVYDAGIETINILRSPISIDEKNQALSQFRRIMGFSFEHPFMREMYGDSKEMHFMFRRLPDMLIEVFEKNIEG